MNGYLQVELTENGVIVTIPHANPGAQGTTHVFTTAGDFSCFMWNWFTESLGDKVPSDKVPSDKVTGEGMLRPVLGDEVTNARNE